MDLSNKPVPIKNLTKIEINNLPDLPFRAIFNGSSGTGKTNAIVNFVNFYKRQNKFDFTFVICPTKDPKLFSLVEDKNDFYLTPDFATLDEIANRVEPIVQRYRQYLKDKEYYEKIKHIDPDNLTLAQLSRIDRMETYPPKDPYGHHPQFCLIIDDSIGSLLFGDGKKNRFVNYFIRARHKGVSIILATQHFKGINKSIRGNTTFYALFKMNDIKQLHDIFLEISSHMDFDTFVNMFNYATKERYNFLYLDLDKGVFKRNFDEVLRPSDFIEQN